MDKALLHINGLKVYYRTKQGPVKAVDGLNLSVNKTERIGIAGESGCGKSTTAIALIRLIKPPGFIKAGQIILDGTDILSLNPEEMRKIRWSRVSLIPQGAMNALNPVARVKSQIEDVIVAHTGSQKRNAMQERIRTLLDMVGLPGHVATMYAHELSGGMKQRVCIAMAIALRPQLIIADEPTSALDVVVQRIVTQTLIEVQEELGASLVIIGHDMGLLAQLVDRLAVMYAGKLAEVGSAREMYTDPLHPYTQLLIASVPSIKAKKVGQQGIPGLPPTLLSPPPGCVFHPRCPKVMEVCRSEVPQLRQMPSKRRVACHLYN